MTQSCCPRQWETAVYVMTSATAQDDQGATAQSRRTVASVGEETAMGRRVTESPRRWWTT